MAQSYRVLLSVALAVSSALLFVSGESTVASRLAGRGVHGLGDQSPSLATVDQANQADAAFSSFQSALSEAIVQEVNAAEGATWTAGMNAYFEGKSYEFLKKSCGTKLGINKLSAAQDQPWTPYPWPTPSVQPKPATVYPTQYDVRAAWGAKCPSVNDIRDQAGCGSCWAVAAAEAMTDRHCIASNGASKPYLSAHNILTCCGAQECGSCEGGYPLNAWQFWSRSGVVTGGAFGSSGTCQPYEWAPCEHHTNGSLPQCVAQDTTPACKNTCSGGMDYAADKSFGSSAYKVAFSEDAIMNEIMTHGPVEAGFMVYEDFPHYKSGVYQHTKGNMIGGHAVKLLGWGVEGTQKYWLVANSWNTNWGDQGYFKIAKGQNECMIEDMIFAGHVRA